MKVVLLAGGFGSRISEESQFKPKPMIEIGGMPILWHIMKEYAYYGHTEFIICAGYKQEYIKEWFANYFLHNSDVTFDYRNGKNEMIVHQTNMEPWKVTVVDTGYNTMTGGRIKRIQKYVGNEPFFMTYGDGVCDVEIDKLIEFHKSHGKLATLTAVKTKFGELLSQMKWLNLGGGHHITRPGYDIARLEKCIRAAKEEWKVDVYLEPGEAWALNAGFFLTTVLDVLQNGDTRLAILDGSAACHMPDVLEMPYRPMVIGSGEPGEKRWNCRLAGKSCLAGDVIGEYSFDEPLKAGDRLVFTDMAIYSMVKTTTFNGLRLPSIVRWNPETDGTRLVREFGYEDFKMRLS